MMDTKELVLTLDDDQLASRGVTTRMPTSLDEALQALENHTDRSGLERVLGPQILNFYGMVKKEEKICLAAVTNDEEPLSLLWRYL